MITNVSTDAEFDSHCRELKNIAEEMLSGIQAEEENILIQKGGSMAGPDKIGQDRFFLLTDGNVPASLTDRVLFYYEPGELVGLECATGSEVLDARLEFAVRANIYDREKALKKIRKDAKRFDMLMEYLSIQSSLFKLMLSATMAATHRPNFQMRSFRKGEDIIRQGDTDKDVYSMINGTADVLVNDTKVAEINSNEIFGEMSELTGAARSATVRAATTCEVMVFGGEDFTDLAESNPVALKDIATNLSERLAHLNKEIGRNNS